MARGSSLWGTRVFSGGSSMSTSFGSRLVAAAVLAGALFAASPAASAQGFCVPDGLEAGPCCGPIVPSLPPFQAVSLPSLGICWGQCTVINTRPLKVTWATPAQTSCGEFNTFLTVSDGISGAVILTGPMVLDYTRTWTEIDPTGVSTQVWRFTAKADLSGVAGVVPVCPSPNCIAPVGPHPTAFFYGYLDYAGCTATSGPTDNVIVLFHNCD